MFGPGEIMRNIHRSGHWETLGNFTYIRGLNIWWYSQRQAAKALRVSPNVLSKYLNGKLPKLICK